MNNELLDQLALKTGGSHFPAVFGYYQREYMLNVLSEIHDVFQKQQFDGYAIDFWDDIVKHFELDYYEIDMLLKNNKETA
jgi:hypothetical protein